MVVAPSILSLLSPLSSSILLHPKTQLNAHLFQTHYSLLPPLALPSPISRTTTTSHHHNKHSSITLNPTGIWRISAAPPANYSLLISEAAEPVEAAAAAEQLATTSDDGVSITISVLLFIAFVGLSVLTIGVIYIAVTDFLQKREKERFEKEEAAKAKKGGRKRKVKARAGPKGFGQKADEADLIDDI